MIIDNYARFHTPTWATKEEAAAYADNVDSGMNPNDAAFAVLEKKNAPASIAAVVAAANAVEVEERELATERAQAAANASFPDAGLLAEEITTVRILRLALFGLPNQEMTVAQLRAALFEVEDQDKRIDLLAANLPRVLGIA